MENVGVFWSGTEALLLEYRWKTWESNFFLIVTHDFDTAKNSSGWGRSRRCWRMTGRDSSSSERKSRAAWWKNLKPGEEGESTFLSSSASSFQSWQYEILLNLTQYYQGGSSHPWRVPAPASYWTGGGALSANSLWSRHPTLKFFVKCCCSNSESGWCRCPSHFHGARDEKVSWKIQFFSFIALGFIQHPSSFVKGNVPETLNCPLRSPELCIVVDHSSLPSQPIVITHYKGNVPLTIAAGDSRRRSGRRWSRVSCILASVSIWDSVVRPLAQRGGISCSL